jgi:hypothetical protein
MTSEAWPGGTGLAPHGQNWALEHQQVFRAWTPALGASAIFESQDSSGPYIFGWDLWGSLTIADVYAQLIKHCKAVYYIGLWRNPPGFPIGIDNYLAIAVHSPS